MAELVVLVLNDPKRVEDVLTAWLTLGIPGVTIVESTGLRQRLGKRPFRDDLPLFPALDDLLEGTQEPHCTLLAVIEDDFDVDGLVAATEQITGRLDAPNTGILFTVPVRRAWGLKRP
jgi:nitrogen regulatory protein P-II 1